MSEYSVFTSESVSEGHPDKIADQISDAVLDAIIAKDKYARVACETLVKTGVAIIAGEVTTSAWVDLEELVRKVIIDIGYDSSDVGFDGATCGVLNIIGKQSVDINQGVDRAKPEDQGAGDQGLMFGYASNETDVLMPAPICFSHRLVERQAEARKSGLLPWLRPDAKSQVTCRYEGGKVVGIDAVVLSTQHNPEVSYNDLRDGVMELIIKQVLPAELLHKDTGKTETLSADSIFVNIGVLPNTDLFKGQLALTESGYIAADENCRTEIPGVFVAGDIREKEIHQLTTAASDGTTAALHAEKYLASLK